MYVICDTYVSVKVHAWFIQNEIRRRWEVGEVQGRGNEKIKRRDVREREVPIEKQMSDI
jgi:hypothetical protein